MTISGPRRRTTTMTTMMTTSRLRRRGRSAACALTGQLIKDTFSSDKSLFQSKKGKINFFDFIYCWIDRHFAKRLSRQGLASIIMKSYLPLSGKTRIHYIYDIHNIHCIYHLHHIHHIVFIIII